VTFTVVDTDWYFPDGSCAEQTVAKKTGINEARSLFIFLFRDID